MKRIALYFGSFNPFHYGHRAVAEGISASGLVDELWFVLSPKSPFKEENVLSDPYRRLHELEESLAQSNGFNWRICDIEFHLPSPLYTWNTLEALCTSHPDCEFSIAMGADNLLSLERWYRGRDIMAAYRLIVYPRPGSDIGKFFRYASGPDGRPLAQKHQDALESEYSFKELVILADAPQNDISSTKIREHNCSQ